MDNFETWLDFRRNENPSEIKLICCDCGKPAEGNVSCDDGELCDNCHSISMEE